MKDDEREAFLAALKRLNRRDYFRAELETFLRRKDFSPDAIRSAVDRCRDMGYVNDHRLAARFAEARADHKGWGPKRIRYELMARGVREEVADKASELEDELFERALAVAVRKAELRAKREWWRAGEGRARMVSSLLRRGFQAEDAHRRVQAVAAQREASDHAIDDQPGDPEGVS